MCELCPQRPESAAFPFGMDAWAARMAARSTANAAVEFGDEPLAEVEAPADARELDGWPGGAYV
jgi:hypothetical protein